MPRSCGRWPAEWKCNRFDGSDFWEYSGYPPPRATHFIHIFEKSTSFRGAVCLKANVKEIRMASKLKIIPLGGLGEIGKNLTVYE